MSIYRIVVLAVCIAGLLLGTVALIANRPQAVQPGSSYSEF